MASIIWIRRLSSALWLLTACNPAGVDTEAPAGSGMTGAGGMENTPAGNVNRPPGATDPSGVAGNGSVGEGGITPLGNVSTSKVPCDVAAIVADHCTTCHGVTPAFNAPMSLVDADDFLAPAPISGTRAVSEVAAQRINAEGAARMPPPGTVEALGADELATLTGWLSAGAPAAFDGCEIGAAVANGAEELLPRPTATGTVLGPYEGWDEGGVECYPFTAYQPGGVDKETPFDVGTAVDKYIGFGFSPPWQGTRYVRAFRSVIDNEQVLHHWILFQEPSARDDSAEEILGAHPGGQMLHGWAPGGSDLYFTPDVGIRMEADTNYLLEVHYNSSDPNATDASGLEICVSDQPPENEAIISWLGSDAINGTSATGTCEPRSNEPIHIIAGTPHMHLKGSHMKVTVNRAGGDSEVVHDEAFSFENQRGYPEDIQLDSGDSITTTCTFSSPARFGKGTNEEMCYWFALAYPAGALADGGFIGTLTHGESSCLGR
jgi:hypothetical protein